jgi:hypothetical protein
VAVSLDNMPRDSGKRTSALAMRQAMRARQSSEDFKPGIALRQRVRANLRKRLRKPPQSGAPERMIPHYMSLSR